jgi:hypothetical protein
MEGRQILDSWKGISAYLKRSERTCRHWELELGLPVHRLDGSPRAHVFAYPEEIERWMKEILGSKRVAEHSRLKKILVPSLVFLIAVAVIGITLWRVLPKKAKIPAPTDARAEVFDSVAIVPIINESGDAEREYFANSLTRQVITELCQVAALRVPPAGSVMAFKGKDLPAKDIAEELGVKAVVEVSWLQVGSRHRLIYSL